MDTVRIKAFLLAVKYGSFSKAAEELSYTPSALSHIADAMEEETGIKILNRTHSGIELTENGKVLCEKFAAIIDAENSLFKAVENIKHGNDTLTVGCYSSISKHLLPEIIKKFKTVYPQVKVSIKVENDMRTLLNSDAADVVFTDHKPEYSSFVSIMNDPFEAVVPKSIFADRKTVSKEELYPFSYISHNEGCLHEYFDESKFKEIIKFDSVDDASIISMVKENIGIAVLSSLILKNAPKGVRVLKLKPEISRTIGFAYKKETAQTGCAAKFIKFIKKEFSLV